MIKKKFKKMFFLLSEHTHFLHIVDSVCIKVKNINMRIYFPYRRLGLAVCHLHLKRQKTADLFANSRPDKVQPYGNTTSMWSNLT